MRVDLSSTHSNMRLGRCDIMCAEHAVFTPHYSVRRSNTNKWRQPHFELLNSITQRVAFRQCTASTRSIEDTCYEIRIMKLFFFALSIPAAHLYCLVEDLGPRNRSNTNRIVISTITAQMFQPSQFFASLWQGKRQKIKISWHCPLMPRSVASLLNAHWPKSSTMRYTDAQLLRNSY